MNHIEQKKAAKKFAKKWENKGYEKGESNSFWLSLLSEVFGVEYPDESIRFEDRVMLDNTSFIDGYIPSTHVLIEQKSIDKDLGKAIRQSDGSLLTPFQQAKRYSAELPYSERPRWVVISNFKEFLIYDMEKPTGKPESLYLENLEDEYYRLLFLVNIDDKNIQKAKEVSIKAGELVGILYNALLKEYEDPEDEKILQDLNALSVRLVFCFYAEDSGLFGRKRMFHDYLLQYKGTHFRGALINLFKILNQKMDERDVYLEDSLAEFPYVNGGLFAEENLVIPRINEEIIDIILNRASLDFNWSKISPTIFGSVFESTLNPHTRRSGGMHYTSIENIHKLTDPLFMDELNDEFEMIKSLKTIKIKEKKLKEFQNKIAAFKFLDPAAGSGNFLTETYISLRKLENKILEILYGNQIVLGIDIVNPIKVSINQFYGIEINDFAVTVAKTALWIAESQMLQETEDIIHTNIEFLPIKNDAKIVEGNALKLNWNSVIDGRDLDYIIGNPPFIGARLMTDEQKLDITNVFGNLKNIGNLDYVTAWFKKAAEMIDINQYIRIAFVATNSICQGEQVAIIWKHLLGNKFCKIDFGYRTFKWNNEARNKAAVYCVIVGFSSQLNKIESKIIYNTKASFEKADNINGYLIDAENIFIESKTKPLSNVPEIGIGNKPIDDGNYLFEKKEMEEFIKKEPNAEKYFKEWYGAREFINKAPRYCLYIDKASPSELRKMPSVMKRIENVRDFRLKSKSKGTIDIAKTPTKFHVTNISEGDYLLIPRVTSENRKYIPIGFMSNSSLASDAVQIMPYATKYHFGILTSNVHMAWMRVVAGRLKGDYRYSKNIVFNNFPWPKPTKKQKEEIIITAQAILDARELYPKETFADLYDELIIPKELRKAHQENDKAVMKAYGFDWRTMTESESVAELMKLYKKIIELK